MGRSLLHQWGLNEGRHPITGRADGGGFIPKEGDHMTDLLDGRTEGDDDEAIAEEKERLRAAHDAGLRAAHEERLEAERDEAQEPRRPSGRLRIGENTKGRYVVLWARKPARGDDARPGWQEVDVVDASSPDQAKRLVLAEDAPFAAFLKHSAAQKPGILLRAVPAMHWPDTIQPTTFVRPEPVLTIG